jgi:hypothetical protein
MKWHLVEGPVTYNTRGSVTTLHDFVGVLGRPLHTFFWALAISWHGSWLVCEVALNSGADQWAMRNNMGLVVRLVVVQTP